MQSIVWRKIVVCPKITVLPFGKFRHGMLTITNINNNDCRQFITFFCTTACLASPSAAASSCDLSALCMTSLSTSISYLFTFRGHDTPTYTARFTSLQILHYIGCVLRLVASCRGSEWHQYRRLLLLLLKMAQVTSLLLILGIFCSAASTEPQGRSLYSTILPPGISFIVCSKSLQCIHFGLSRRCFFGHNSPNLNGSAWSLEYKWGVMVHTHKGCQRVLFLFCYATNAAFQSLILHRFRTFMKCKMRIDVRMRTLVKNFRISA